MFWHEKPGWQLCVPVTHSSTSATQRLDIRGGWEAGVGGRWAPTSHPATQPQVPHLHTTVISAVTEVCIPARWRG